MPETETRGLKALLRAVGRLQADALLSAVYYLALGPTALLVKLWGCDALGLRADKPGWTEREAVEPAEHLRRQG